MGLKYLDFGSVIQNLLSRTNSMTKNIGYCTIGDTVFFILRFAVKASFINKTRNTEQLAT